MVYLIIHDSIIDKIILKKLGIELPYGPAIPLFGIYSEEIKIERDTCTPTFTVALFTRAST